LSDDGATHRPFVTGGSLHLLHPREWSRRSIASLAILTVFVLLPVRGLYRATGSSMEEGFMLVFPRLVREGWVPNADFLHLYGPGSLHVLAGWYTLFGDALEVQRTFGLLQHVGIITALYALTRVWGHFVALLSAVVAGLMVLTPIGLSALAWHGALALALWALVIALRARSLDGRAQCWAIATAGFLAGMALSFRPDIVLGLAVSLGVLWWRVRPDWRWSFGGVAVGLIPMWAHLLMAGIPASVQGMILDPVFELRPGRELPRPPSFSHIDGALQFVAELIPPWWGPPAMSAEKQLFFWFWAVVLIAIGVPFYAWRVRRRGDRGVQSDVLLYAGLFGLGILPQAMQRPDSTHLAWVACVSWPLATAALADALRRTGWSAHRLRRHLTTAGVVTLVLFVICPFFTLRHYLLHTRVSVGNLPVPHVVERGDRRFWFGDPVAADALRSAVSALELVAEEGDRLLVGPADLSRTVYSDVAIYYLFPELEPATYYIEMDPGLANSEGSGLDEDVSSADYLVLTNLWTGWWEPNTSGDWGWQVPNEIVANEFCLIGTWNDHMAMLFERCEGGGGFNPAEVAATPIPAGAAGQ